MLEQNPEKLDAKFLSSLELEDESQSVTDDSASKTPDDLVENGFSQIQRLLEDELLDRIKSKSPEFFENLIMELCKKMFNGSGHVTGRSGDGGIDGIVDRDELGLDQIFLQAKRWEANVSEPTVSDFAGSLQKFRAKRGIFITTSDFASPAKNFVNQIDSRIILVNGRQLVRHMINHGIGVKTLSVYEIKKVDEDYSIEDD